MTPFLENLTATIGDRFGCSHGEIIGHGKEARCVKARRLIWAIARWHNPAAYSTVQLGRYFNRDHSTVVTGLQKLSGIPRGSVKQPSAFKLAPKHIAAVRKAGYSKGLRAIAQELGCGVKTVHKAREALRAAGDWPHGPYMGIRPIRNRPRRGTAPRTAAST